MALIAKVCLLGDGFVGKTSLANRFLGKGFISDYIPTLGSDFTSKQISLETDFGRQEIRFQIWDLAGQPSFSTIRSFYYKGAAGAFLVFDLTSPDSLESLQKWSDEFLKHCKVSNPTLIVLGNKFDLEDEIRISSKSVEYYIKSRLLDNQNTTENEIKFYETSAKTGLNVDKVFELLGRKISKKML